MSIKILPAYAFPSEISELFTEYTNMLIENDAEFAKYLEIQKYDDELKNLQAKYGPPQGRLYMALAEVSGIDSKTAEASQKLCGAKGGQVNFVPAGCIGLKKIDNENCEMKRLYVRPQFRGQEIGRKLVCRIISDAREIGYSHMLLDTLPFLTSALRIYKEYGFYEIPSYNDSPMNTSIYMQIDL